MLTPTKDQAQAIRTMISGMQKYGACAVLSSMGTGKTLTAVESVKGLDARTILVIAPLSTRESWQGTFDEQGVTLPFEWINSTKTGKAALDAFMWETPGIYFVGIEYFARIAFEKKQRFEKNMKGESIPKTDKNGKPIKTTVPANIWNVTRPDMVIFDESHRAQNFTSVTYKALRLLSPKYKLAQSGTFAGNSFEGAHAVSAWLFPEYVEQNPWVWREKWCATVYDHFAVRNQRVVGEKVPGAFFGSLPCVVKVEADFGEADDQRVYVDLGSKQRKAYNELVQNMVAWVQDSASNTDMPVVVEFPITLRARLRQASLGMFTTNADGEVFFDTECQSTKLDKMFELLEGEFEEAPALIFTDSAKFAKVATARINARYGEGTAVEWSGNVPMNKRPENKQAFLDGKHRYIVGVMSAMGTGTDGLQKRARHMVWLSQSDSRIDNEQALSRLLRGGQTGKVISRRIVALNTYDSGQLDKQIVDALKMNESIRVRGEK